MKILISFIFAVLLVACGGSAGCNAAGALLGAAASSACSNSNNSSPTVATGYFIDSAVQGLAYVSGSQSGVTGADGSFKYEIGKPITFSIGGLTLGTVPIAGGYITPIDLVSNGSITDQQVINITSLLMSLDSNQTVSDGIQLSSSTLSAAASWLPSQLNFNQANSTFAAQALALTGFALQSEANAVAHLTSTLRCVQSGVFIGKGQEDPTLGGLWGSGGFLSDSITGNISGAYVADDRTAYGTATGASPISLDQMSSFVSGSTSSGATFTGNLTPNGVNKFNQISDGKWAQSTKKGTFSATRVGGDANAKIRISGYFLTTAPDFILYSIDISPTNIISGKFYKVANGYSHSQSTTNILGTLTGNQIIAMTNSGENINATINHITGNISNVFWSGGAAIYPATSSGSSGCLLNGFQS